MKSSSVKAVIFDLDDTLWPLAPALLKAEAALYDWLHIHMPGIPQRFSRDELRKLRMELQLTDPQYRFDVWALRHAALTQACHLSGEDPMSVDHAMEIFSAERNTVIPFDDVLPGLERLGEHFALGSISNGPADLHAIGIAHHFRISLAAHQFGSAKPGPEIFLAACDALSIAPHEAVYVGDDSVLDIQGAQNAGLRAVWMNRFSETLPAHIKPAASCTTLHELYVWLQRA